MTKRNLKKSNNIKRTKSIQAVIQEQKQNPFKNTSLRSAPKDQSPPPPPPPPPKVTKKIQKKSPKKEQKPKKAEKKEEEPKKAVKKSTNIKKHISNSSFKNEKFKQEEIPNFINMEYLQEGIHEMDQYQNFKEKYLGKEGAFSAYKVLIGQFYSDFDFDNCAGKELKLRGFKYTIEKDFDRFVNKINQYDIVWVISSCDERKENQKKKYMKEMDKFIKAKKSLFLFGDKDPLFVEVNYILEKYFNGMKMAGDYVGLEIVNKSENDIIGKGTFDKNHSIGYGLNHIFEGVSICHPENVHPDFKHFAYNTNNEPLISFAEENENHGRIVLDCGFTKLFPQYWNSVGTHQYISNANVWLTGIPQ